MKSLITAFLLLTYCICSAQQQRDELYFSSMNNYKLVQNYNTSAHKTIPFKTIHVIDARPDTNSVGFLRLFALKDFHKLIFKKGLSNEIYDYSNNTFSYSDTSSNNLLLIIKEYRISNYASILNQSQINVSSWRRGIILSAELFMENNNNYHALYKIDSIVTNDSAHLLNKLVQQSFNALFSHVANKNIAQLHVGKTPFSLADIQQHIESFYNYPVLKDSLLKRGVYKHFKDFVANNPSQINYEIHAGKLSDELFITENNQTYPLHDFWGFCDGKNIYLKSVDNIFKLVKTSNTFNVFGAKSINANEDVGKEMLTSIGTTSIVKLSGGGVYRTSPNFSNFKISLAAFQLSMQTGELY